MNPQNHEEDARHSFDSFSKKVLKNAARDYHRALNRRAERETAFSALPERELAKLAVTDTYFADEYVFPVLGASVGVTGCELGEALNALPADRREIVLMSYFFDMTDKEIAARLNLKRRTVQYQRTSSLRVLKNLLESED
jgi:DNA-directed RNA polymerase specialized sigma24 family protein